MPHSHRDDRVYTVISGTYYVGEGEKFDKAALKPVVLQVNGVRPTDFTYVNPADDPRKK